MSTILPPPSTPQPVPPASLTAALVTASDPPTAVVHLTPGAIVKADIVQALAPGLVRAQTEYGAIQLRTGLALALGVRLELQLLRTTPQVQFSVRTVDGHAVPGASARPATSAPAGHPGGPAFASGGQAPASGASAVFFATDSPIAPVTVGSIVRATLHGPIPGIPPAAVSISPGDPAPATGAVPDAGRPPSSIASPPSAAGAPGTPVAIRILGIAAPSQVQPGASPGGSRHGAIDGTVAAFSANGRPVVQTPLGLMTLGATPADLRLGAQIRLELVSPPVRETPSVTTASIAETFIQTRSWPALDDTIAHLGLRPPGFPPVALPLPQANNQLGSRLLLFLNALKGNDVRAWLGDGAAILDRERPDLAGRVNDEFAQLARVLNEAPADDWRTAIIPFFGGAQLEPVQMHIRGGKSQKGDKDEDEGSRFIIDIQLSRLGRIQLDGFVRKRGRDKKSFDLIVRTARPMPQSMRHDINQIFTGFGEAAGLIGLITFQARAPFVEVPVPRLAQVADDGLFV